MCIRDRNDNQKTALEYILDKHSFYGDDEFYEYDLPTVVENAFQNLKEHEENYVLSILIKLEELEVSKEVLDILKNERELDEVLRKNETMKNLDTLMNNLKKGSSDKDWNTK